LTLSALKVRRFLGWILPLLAKLILVLQFHV